MRISYYIKKCDMCQFVESQHTPSTGFGSDYYCGKNNKKIAGYVEWDSEMPPVPQWCPLLAQTKTLKRAIEIIGRKELQAILLVDEDEAVREFAKEI